MRSRIEVAVVLAAALACAVAPLRAQAEPPARTLALLVGIDAYAPSDGEPIGTLRGAENDIAGVAELLTQRFHVAADDLTILRGAAATHEAIVRAFHERLVQRATAATRVLVWFSGHGSQVPDPSRRDTAAGNDDAPRDQTFLAYDSRAGDRDGRLDLTDDELRSLLLALPARDVVVVADCCHSGGAVRGARIATVRGAGEGREPLDRDAIAAFFPVPFVDDHEGDRGDVDHVVFLAACGSDQEAGEIEGPDGWHGTLTWALRDVLAEAAPDRSWRWALETARARMAALGSRVEQVPEGSGRLDRAIFGGTARPLPAGYAVRRDTERLVQICAGRVHGLADGATVHLVDDAGAEVARAVVTRANACSSRARITEGALQKRGAVFARVDAGLGGRTPLRVFCGDGIDRELLADDAFVLRVEERTDADCVLVRAGAALELQERDGTFVREVPADAPGARLALFREHAFRALWEAAAQRGDAPFEIEVAAVPDGGAVVEAATGRAHVTAPWFETVERDGERVTRGGLVEFTLRNRGPAAVVALLSVTEDREVHVISNDANNLLQTGASMTVRAIVGPSRAWRRDRPMVDRYLAIATSRFADFGPFESTVEHVGTRGGDAALPPFLLDALGVARGGGDTPAWGIGHFDLLLSLLPPK